MDVLQHQMMCTVCTDKRKFQRAVEDARRISNQLYGLTKDLPESEDNRLLMAMQFDVMHIHMMCGSCYKVDETELRRYEREMDKALLKVIKSGDKSLLRQSLGLLSGYYPGKYHFVERTFQKLKIENAN